MILGEIPKTDNLTISFNIGDKHFDFSTSILPKVDKENPDSVIYTDPIVIQDSYLKIDNNKCTDQEIRYFNQRSGRTHIWSDPEIEYRKEPRSHYVIKCSAASVPKNRRRALRVPINYKTSCTMSLLNGKYPCTVYDVSVTGVGINIDIALAEKNPLHRLVYTQFKDDILNKDFYITARVLHTTQLDSKTSRCGCELVSISPSINEYINLRQMHKLAKANILDEMTDSTDTLSPETEAAPVEEKPDQGIHFSEKFRNDHPFEFLEHGDMCPVCENGRLKLYNGVFICSNCESIIEP